MGLKIKKGDTVRVISGENAGASGRVIQVLTKKNRAIVEGVNMVRKHMKARSQQEPGGIIDREAPLHMSNLMLVDPKTGTASRFANGQDDKGNKVRKLKKSQAEV